MRDLLNPILPNTELLYYLFKTPRAILELSREEHNEIVYASQYLEFCIKVIETDGPVFIPDKIKLMIEKSISAGNLSNALLKIKFMKVISSPDMKTTVVVALIEFVNTVGVRFRKSYDDQKKLAEQLKF